ncbi:Thioesterase superfamily [Artemisia annua]|uniref:Acyl-coenzyme A thioesterase 13 n=1 Tax=Artemisia annua TaxID=35608 RepID=A0A2U1N1B7_ARTAN|nr:Thioesterase superfamily [Artemisia annua]
MEKSTREYLEVAQQDSDRVTRLTIPPPLPEAVHSFYELFAIKGIRLENFQPGFISYCFIVPPRLTDRNGNLAVGAVATIVDKIGASVLYRKVGRRMHVSVDMSISYLSTAKLNDELEITTKLIGIKGSYKGILVVLKNKSTGEIIAEGRHSLFALPSSKI